MNNKSLKIVIEKVLLDYLLEFQDSNGTNSISFNDYLT